MQHRAWYAKVAMGSAIMGGGMEFFMIKTGFYEKVTAIEAERRAELKASQPSHESTGPLLPSTSGNSGQNS